MQTVISEIPKRATSPQLQWTSYIVLNDFPGIPGEWCPLLLCNSAALDLRS